MKALHELRDMLSQEIDEITKKGELTAGSLDTVDKLTHSLKSIDTIIAMHGGDDEYSQRGYSNTDGHMGGGYSGNYPRYYYAKNGNQRRDSRGRYSRDDGREQMIEQLRDMMNDAPDDHMREAIRKCVEQMERE